MMKKDLNIIYSEHCNCSSINTEFINQDFYFTNLEQL